jgi:transcriptional regulator with XRE-family HTH domain
METMYEWEWLEHFGDKLKDILLEYGWSQADLAHATNMSEPTISSYINKTRMPGIKAVINISYVLNVSLDDLIDFGKPIW